MLATTVAGPDQDVAFFNETEIQLRGPVQRFHTKILTHSTDVFEALTGKAGETPDPLRNSRPDTPTDEQKKAFADEHGALLP